MKTRVGRSNWFLFVSILFLCLPLVAFAQPKENLKFQSAPQTSQVKALATKAAPDLIVSNINMSPGKPTTITPITVWTFVKNNSAVPAPASTLQLQIGGKIYPPIAVPALPANKEWRHTSEVEALKAGNYRITGIINPQKQIVEARYDNNKNIKNFAVTAAPMVTITSITWNRPTKRWVATVKNTSSVPVPVAVVGFPLENGVQGMTKWANVNLAAHGSYSLAGDYSPFNVPPGTRLKVHVKKDNSNELFDEKIIVLD